MERKLEQALEILMLERGYVWVPKLGSWLLRAEADHLGYSYSSPFV